MRKAFLPILSLVIVGAFLCASAAGAGGTGIRELLTQAESGNAKAQNELGLRYVNGDGVGQDDLAATRWFRKAAEQGFAEAQYNLSVMFANGQGVRQDDDETVKWSELAARQGHPHAQYQLGLLYAVGAGVKQNFVRAYLWFQLAMNKLDGSDREMAEIDLKLVADNMTTDQLSEARRLVREWRPNSEQAALTPAPNGGLLTKN